MFRKVHLALALLIALLGAGAILTGVLSWFDPVGAGLANDSDPWTPATRDGSAIVVLIGVLCVVLGAYLFWRNRNDR